MSNENTNDYAKWIFGFSTMILGVLTMILGVLNYKIGVERRNAEKQLEEIKAKVEIEI